MRRSWFAAVAIVAVVAAAFSLAACRPAKCDCSFDKTLEAAIAACPPDPNFATDMGGPSAVDDGGAPAEPSTDLSANAGDPIPSSCLTIARVALADAPLRQGRSPLSLVLDSLALDEPVTVVAERAAFANETIYRVVQRGDDAACGYVEANAIVPTEKARTTKRNIDPATDSATCISGR